MSAPRISNSGSSSDSSINFWKIDEFIAKMRRLRAKAEKAPLVPGLFFSFTLIPPPSKTPQGSRGLPWFAKQRSDNANTTCQCVLEKPLQDGIDQWSQVWLAKVNPPHGEAGHSATVVLKFIQPSLLPFPEDGRFRTAKELATTEHQAYTTLRPLQGRSIPRCYGFEKVITPSGERAWLLVLEYIEGTALWKINTIKPSLKTSCTLYVNAMNALNNIHETGIIHCDIAGRNIIALPDKPEVVWIDFACASLASKGNATSRREYELWQLTNEVQRCFKKRSTEMQEAFESGKEPIPEEFRHLLPLLEYD
ncbi:hypothetical protein M0805_006163 [Coniferiporia weirii]|nr:hypothetical protein M0805_006163 [Coniferiporia weirii]